MLSIFDIYDFLGPKPSYGCYRLVYEGIDSGSFKSVAAIKHYVANRIKRSFNKEVIEQSKDILDFIVQNENR